MNLETTFKFVEELTHIDCSKKTIFELMTSTSEELGELSREILIEEKSFGNNYKSVDEGSKAESVDLTICALAIFFARGGTVDEFVEIANKKLSKWEGNQSAENPPVVKTVVCLNWIESERGWGCRPDGSSLHLTKQDVDKYVKDYWNKMPDVTPDEYSRPDGQPFLVTVNEEVYKRVLESKFGIRTADRFNS
jgi:hypothetical protein